MAAVDEITSPITNSHARSCTERSAAPPMSSRRKTERSGAPSLSGSWTNLHGMSHDPNRNSAKAIGSCAIPRYRGNGEERTSPRSCEHESLPKSHSQSSSSRRCCLGENSLTDAHQRKKGRDPKTSALPLPRRIQTIPPHGGEGFSSAGEAAGREHEKRSPVEEPTSTSSWSRRYRSGEPRRKPRKPRRKGSESLGRGPDPSGGKPTPPDGGEGIPPLPRPREPKYIRTKPHPTLPRRR